MFKTVFQLFIKALESFWKELCFIMQNYKLKMKESGTFCNFSKAHSWRLHGLYCLYLKGFPMFEVGDCRFSFFRLLYISTSPITTNSNI